MFRKPVTDDAGHINCSTESLHVVNFSSFDNPIDAFIYERCEGNLCEYDDLKEKARKRLTSLSSVYICYMQKRAIGWIWRSPAGYMEYCFIDEKMLADEILFFDVYILSEYRRKGYYEFFFNTVQRMEHKNGAKFISVAIERRNLPSIKAHRKLGFNNTIAQGWDMHLFGLNLCHHEGNIIPSEYLITNQAGFIWQAKVAFRLLKQYRQHFNFNFQGDQE